MSFEQIVPLLDQAIASRAPLLEPPHETAFRLFNGFIEGYPDLVLDVYGSTLVIHDYAEKPDPALIREVVNYICAAINWLRAGIVKTRNGKSPEETRGILFFGEKPDRKIRELGIWYALNLTLNRDASFYLDTRNLRKWLIEHAGGKTVLNTFAYTGSLGAAAMAGGAERVIQTDRSRLFLNLAKETYSLNGFPIHKADFLTADFFPAVARFKAARQLFDIVLLDPPFFSTTPRGKVDLEHQSARLINKVRPLVKDGGTLVAINNALFVSGKEYMQTLEELCKDGYLSIKELIPVPQDFIGYHPVGAPVADPAPFNHATKIAVLEVRRKNT
ncbi:MAG: class I SAM-dependent methyltransferase [Chloroflexota bacterium]